MTWTARKDLPYLVALRYRHLVERKEHLGVVDQCGHAVQEIHCTITFSCVHRHTLKAQYLTQDTAVVLLKSTRDVTPPSVPGVDY